jgi:uncharacterized protein YuzE
MKSLLRLEMKSKPISVSVDTLARAVYITISNNPVSKTVRKNESFLIDYDKEGKVVGLEIVRVEKMEATVKKVIKETEQGIPAAYRKTLDKYLQLA